MEDLMGMFGPPGDEMAGGSLGPTAPPSDPVRKPEAGYRPSQPGDEGACESCQHFVPPEGCTLVLGKIEPEGVCDYWEAANTEQMLESGVDEFLFSGGV